MGNHIIEDPQVPSNHEGGGPFYHDPSAYIYHLYYLSIIAKF